LREVETPTFSDIQQTDGGKVVNPKRQPLLTPERFLVLIFGADWVDPRAIGRLQGLGKWKNSTSSGTRTGDPLGYSIVPQPTMLRRAPLYSIIVMNMRQCMIKGLTDRSCKRWL
jgi:hypothetical protein